MMEIDGDDDYGDDEEYINGDGEDDYDDCEEYVMIVVKTM
jgi:hypothetical protein